MNSELPPQSKPVEKAMELRAHHLFTLSRLHFWRAHKSESAENLSRLWQRGKFKLFGRGEAFADHLINSVLAILQKEVGTITITDSYDEICKECPQKGNTHCHVAGKKWTQEFLSLVDDTVARNTKGILEIGKEYPSAYLMEHMDDIRSALRKTIMDLPGIWTIGKKMQQIIDEEEREK